MKVKATCSSETSIDFQWTTRRYIPEDNTHLIAMSLTSRRVSELTGVKYNQTVHVDFVSQ
jgi:hypothetical protein